jgi:salicylate hydroxylase
MLSGTLAGKWCSFVCYPLSSDRLINMVAFVPTNLVSEESWTAPGDLKALDAEYAGWDDPVRETIGALDQTFRWGIYDRAPLPYWSTGRMMLLESEHQNGPRCPRITRRTRKGAP